MRAQLEDVATVALIQNRRRAPGWVPGAALLVAGLVTGGTVSAAAVTSLQPASQPAPRSGPIEAPPGVLPGVPIISLLGETVSYEITGGTALDLPEPPDGTTHLRTTVTCLTAGPLSWGTDPEGNNPSLYCSGDDVQAGTGTAEMDFPLGAESQDLFAQTGPDGRALLVVQYVNYVPTALGRNASGETYGAAWEGLEPDLVAVMGVAPDGSSILGYARATDLNAFGPDWPGQPTSPEEALEWQRERDERYPDGWEVPVYSPDGRTVLGTFFISN
ncbi:MAG: hypothetical protein Q7J04_10255 [Microcella sp.]|nr:hypothetical protein [Microcella sp.]